VFEKLISILRGDAPLKAATEDFERMLELCREMIVDASAVYWGRELSPEEATALYERDVKVNKLERHIRKCVVAHLSGPSATEVPYGLLMMSLVKDAERLGDYAKNLAEVPGLTGVTADELPEDAVVGELSEIRRAVESLAKEGVNVYRRSDDERARELTVEGRSILKRCDKLIPRIADGDYSASVAVYLTLGVRFYKRIEGHLLNLLSSIIMPLHKLDYYDEKALKHGG
jgi:phosphate uptake regulator